MAIYILCKLDKGWRTGWGCGCLVLRGPTSLIYIGKVSAPDLVDNIAEVPLGTCLVVSTVITLNYLLLDSVGMHRHAHAA